MNKLEKIFASRRGFLVSGTRSLVLLAFAAFAGEQELKRRRLANDPNCIRLSTCSDCLDFGSCNKPKAKEARQTEATRTRSPA